MEDKIKTFRVVLPVADLISPKTFQFSKAMIAKGVFNWDLEFVWKYIPWEYWDLTENNIKPFRQVFFSDNRGNIFGKISCT